MWRFILTGKETLTFYFFENKMPTLFLIGSLPRTQALYVAAMARVTFAWAARHPVRYPLNGVGNQSAWLQGRFITTNTCMQRSLAYIFRTLIVST